MNEFCEAYNLKNLVKEPTCFKNPLNLKCVHLMLTNRPNSSRNNLFAETGLSEFHKMAITALKNMYCDPKIIYRYYKYFTMNYFKQS